MAKKEAVAVATETPAPPEEAPVPEVAVEQPLATVQITADDRSRLGFYALKQAIEGPITRALLDAPPDCSLIVTITRA